MFRKCVLLIVLSAVGASPIKAQDVGAENLPGATRVQRTPDAPVDSLARTDANSITFSAPGPPGQAAVRLVVHNFAFNGDPVTTDKVHLRQVAPGVVEITSVAWEVGYWRFQVRDAASFYGFGERFDTLDHAHTIVKNLSMDNAGVKGESTYKPMPFFLSTTGYGFWLDTTGEATFDMNAGNRDELTIDATTAKLRIVLFTGPDFPTILDHFTAQTQRAIVPPYWAFAPWKARDYHQNQAQVKEDVDRNRELGLPASVILIDSPWTEAYNDYHFNPKQFTDAAAMAKYIHAQGYKLVLWHTSWIDNHSDPPKEAGFANKMKPESDNYQFAADQGLFVKSAHGGPWQGRWWKGEGSLIDFTNFKAKQWWQDEVRQAIAAGADGFKDDDAEGAFLGDDVRFADGSDPRLMRNRYGVLYNNAVEEIIQKDLHGNGVLFARSVTAGANGIGFLWGGDNEASFSPLNGLPTVVTAGLGAGLSGMPLWAADLGGYLGQPDTPNPLLLERWTEYAAFSPLMEVMSSKNISPWNFDSDRKGIDADSETGAPVPDSHEALDIYRKYAVLHMSLFPYRYAAAQEAARDGMPILRALILNYQNDPRARTTKDEYLFGPDFLVAPILDEGTQRTVYLPAGAWVDYWTGKPAAGGQVVTADAPRDVIPVWARAGAIVPKIPEDVMTLVPPSESGNTTVHSLDDRRVYELVPGTGPAATTLTDFEGRALVRSGNSLRITGKPARVTVRWRFGSVGSATVNGAPATVQTGPDGPFIDFQHTVENSVVEWQEAPPPLPIPELEPTTPGATPPAGAAAPASRAPVTGGAVIGVPTGTAQPATVPSASPAPIAPAAPSSAAQPKTKSARPAASSTPSKPAVHHRSTRRTRRRRKPTSSSNSSSSSSSTGKPPQ